MSDPGTELAREFRAGKREAFEPLVELYRERLYRVAYRLTHSAEDALDVAQETFVKVYEGISRWDERSAFYSWTYRVAVNLAIDKLRQRKKAQRMTAGRADAERRAEAPPDGYAEAERRDQLERLARAVEALPEAQRTTVVLRHFEGLALQEIADIRGCALGTVKSTLFQAFQSLQRAMAGSGGE